MWEAITLPASHAYHADQCAALALLALKRRLTALTPLSLPPPSGRVRPAHLLRGPRAARPRHADSPSTPPAAPADSVTPPPLHTACRLAQVASGLHTYYADHCAALALLALDMLDALRGYQGVDGQPLQVCARA